MRIGIMTPGFTANDAVSNDVLGMYQALRARGDTPLIFTPTGESESPLPVYHYADATFMLPSTDDLLVYHCCVADPTGISYLSRLKCRMAVKYHNITPAHMFSPYSQQFARTSRIGRELLPRLLDMAFDGFISDSRYNADELIALGAPSERSYIVPPLHRIEDLLALHDDPATVRSIEQNFLNVVAVGRLVPNKAFDAMARSFGDIIASKKIDFHLHIVGAHDMRMQAYIDLIGRTMADRGIWDKFTFHGMANETVLATLYRHCDLFWTTSLHEGFCVPAVEAMAFGLPVLSSREGALPETCGDAAEYGTSEQEFTEQAIQILSDASLKRCLKDKGRRRYETLFSNSVLNKQFVRTVDQIMVVAENVGLTADAIPLGASWFGIPNGEMIVRHAFKVSPPLSHYGLEGKDRQADFIDWILREARRSSAEIRHLLEQPAFREYANQIPVPPPARHISPTMRLAWRFNRFARTRFDLKSWEDTMSFEHWFHREGAAYLA